MTYGDLRGVLYDNYCRVHNDCKPYRIWYSEKTKKYFPVSCYDDEICPKEILARIRQDAGV